MKKNLSPPPPSIQSFVDDCKINKKENVSENILTGNPQSTHSTSHLLAFDWTAREKKFKEFFSFRFEWKMTMTMILDVKKQSYLSSDIHTHTIRNKKITLNLSNNDDFFVSSIKCDDGKVPSTFALAQDFFYGNFSWYFLNIQNTRKLNSEKRAKNPLQNVLEAADLLRRTKSHQLCMKKFSLYVWRKWIFTMW